MLITSLILRLRHLLYDIGWIKSTGSEIPTICIGNVAVGGTGKTPMTELVIRTLKEGEVESAEAELYGFSGGLFDVLPKQIAVLSRGYGRKTSGFLVVDGSGTAEQFGDEPLLIKRRFPNVVVAVDEDRVRGCDYLAHPHKSGTHFYRPDVIILDDAFQYRKLVPDKSIVLTTYDRPLYRDYLMPFGRLRDLKSRVRKADMLIMTKCPSYLDSWEKSNMASNMGLKQYDAQTCLGEYEDGKKQFLLFATTVYDTLLPVFPDGDSRYTHSKSVILFTAIVNDAPLVGWLCESYKLLRHDRYPDHHFFTKSDIAHLENESSFFPTALIVTTEKDAQRLRSFEGFPEILRKKLFYAPIHTTMLSAAEQKVFTSFVTE